ncbi:MULTISPECIES: MarR family transcriptional regulator [unclassified Streptomyces]|uniref:MarR family winged helix-turn-helix transcriptional regulator n=1 Tax=unclassified Streptomyces TaxID=2593676 RepID=UPI00224E65C0|nr:MULTISPECIES: MarR family transcriptional regulator [unclassified Streptomyces]WSG54838.1 MarR family transcriptional regulator [Streptomyces sp. NBC_01732]WSX05553.1 MarR family transcriptional regulator [Streptomyces sp. NBC_00987]MCX4392200.1 MarR family transcriptional regulator [Streptomyces sp. NBC_01767]MCX5104326.1 MarR family transcriptional regulator [Streptomyces sp. NBC_00439]MCX5504745.1 MarR family transcriptional regulator [Streptomyces sp. NBC_00052]
MAAGDLPDELAGLLPRIQRLARRRLWSGQSAPRLRGAHAELLRLVAAEPGIRISTAAHSLCLAPNSVSTLVNHLVAEGLLRREKDPGDRRAALLYPTRAGVGKLSDWHARREALFREHLAGLDAADRAALAAALPALHRLSASLRNQGDETA